MDDQQDEKPSKREGKPLTPRQQRFVQEYLVDLNATQAAIRAGYSPNGAEVAGAQALRNPKIAEAVRKGQERREVRTEITQDRVLRELALLAFSDVTHYAVDDLGNLSLVAGAPEGARRAVSSIKRRVTFSKDGERTVETELKLWDKPGPLKLAGKHVGLFDDRVEVAPPTIIVNTGLPPSKDDADKAP